MRTQAVTPATTAPMTANTSRQASEGHANMGDAKRGMIASDRRRCGEQQRDRGANEW